MAVFRSAVFGKIRQKYGDAVAYDLNGQNVLRTQAEKVSNPRTLAQMEQRVKLANLVQFYKRMRPWAKQGAFQTKKATLSDYNAFVQANSGQNDVYLTKEQNAKGACVIAPYTLTKGSLNPVSTYVPTGSSQFASNINFGDDDDLAISIGEFSENIIAQNNGILDGDQISMIVAIQRAENGVPYLVMRAYELTLDVNSTTMLDLNKFPISMYDTGGVNDPESYVLAHTFDDTMVGCAFIISRKVGGKLLVSSSTLTLNDAAIRYSATFRGSAQLATAIDSYGTSADNFLDPGTVAGSSNITPIRGINIVQISYNGRTYNEGAEGPILTDNSDVNIYIDSPLGESDAAFATAYGKNGETLASGLPLADTGSYLVLTLPSSALNANKRLVQIVLTAAGRSSAFTMTAPASGDADDGDVTP